MGITVFSYPFIFLPSSLENRDDTQSGAGNRGDGKAYSSIGRIRELLCKRMLFMLSGASDLLCFQKPFVLI